MSETTSELPITDTGKEKLLDQSSQLQYDQERKRKHDEAIKKLFQLVFGFIMFAGYVTAFILVLLFGVVLAGNDGKHHFKSEMPDLCNSYQTCLAGTIVCSIITGLPVIILIALIIGGILHSIYKTFCFPIIDYYYPTELDDDNL